MLNMQLDAPSVTLHRCAPVHQGGRCRTGRGAILSAGATNARTSSPRSPLKDGFAPLHLASALGQLDTVRLLLERGAEVDDRDKVRGLGKRGGTLNGS